MTCMRHEQLMSTRTFARVRGALALFRRLQTGPGRRGCLPVAAGWNAMKSLWGRRLRSVSSCRHGGVRLSLDFFFLRKSSFASFSLVPLLGLKYCKAKVASEKMPKNKNTITRQKYFWFSSSVSMSY
eukprot:30341_6